MGSKPSLCGGQFALLKGMEQLCRVCGAPMVQQLVRCPKCETPHHRDCWEYNVGCAIYGCNATQFTPLAGGSGAEPAIVSVEEPSLLEGISRWLGGLFQPQPAVPLPALDRDRTELELERKEVTRWIGAGAPQALLHAYALFEQRHPRETLGSAAQPAAALEMLDAGFAALGLEAVDKALRRVPKHDLEPLLIRRAEALERDRATRWEALQARAECGGQSGADELLERLREEMLLARMDESSAYVASLQARGWEQESQGPLSHAYYADDALPERGRLLTGPLELSLARDQVMKRWRAGLPSLAVPASRLDLPPRCERVHRLHFSSREAVLETERTEHRFLWSELHAVFYALIHTSKLERKVVHEEYDGDSRGPRVTQTTSMLVQSDEFEPVLELHAGDHPSRFRIDRPDGRLFEYLGRRRTLSHDRNVVLAAKDAVRFAPAARVSHGLLGLLMEQLGPGTRFSSLVDFEEYVLWFHALRS